MDLNALHAMSDENLKQLQYVLNEHIALFPRRAAMTVIWQAPSATLGLVTLAW
ncbi:hypothetical protein [Methylophilus rhizosphaerae]|uniref:hypothetical protein n=1 Tax=Methylophilus rhizosphaerae TaxID=492660 RepID=UPI0015A43A46|nr:hypothetical protein [Methylophilus rhizosphaerae]